MMMMYFVMLSEKKLLCILTLLVHHEKIGLWGFRPGLTQIDLYSHRRWLEALNFGFRKRRNFTILVKKTKALISYAKAKICFSHDMA